MLMACSCMLLATASAEMLLLQLWAIHGVSSTWTVLLLLSSILGLLETLPQASLCCWQGTGINRLLLQSCHQCGPAGSCLVH